MNNAQDALRALDVRRAPSTAIGGWRASRSPADPEPVQQQRRPFTTIGGSLFDLDATHGAASTSTRLSTPLQPVGAATSRLRSAVEAQPAREFDVRKFVSDQKGSEPLHKSALFRASTVLDDELSRLASSRGPAASKKRLPRMEHVPKSTSNSNQTPAAPLAEDTTVSHFYTLEKMAESCFHAVQSKQHKTWQFLPGAEERSKSSSGVSANASSGGANSLTNIERPSRRVDVLDLEKCFDLAMQFVQSKSQHQWTQSNSATAASQQEMATLDRDIMTIEAKVVQRQATFAMPRAKLPSGEDGSDSVVETLSDDQKALARTLFEQKWSDVVLGEIEAMLTMSFLEQGSLLRKTRIRYGKSFFKLERLYNERSKELLETREALDRTRDELRLVNEGHAQDTEQMKEQYEAEIRRLSVGFESRREEMERKVTESKDQMAKMGDTMKTLNTIFRQMREDTEKVKAVELRENYIKLEKKHEAAKEELERLRPLVQANQRLHDEKAALLAENQTLLDKIAGFDLVLMSKDAAIANLMEQQSEMMAEQELRAAQEEELRRLEETKAAEDEEDDDYGVGGGDDDEHASKSQRRKGRGGSAAVCVRCKENLRTMSQGGTLLGPQTTTPAVVDNDLMRDIPQSNTVDFKKKRIQCLYFRILLPNLRGRRPQRELAWTLSCMRSILFAKQLDDMMCKRSGGAFPLRIRMPEFVYSWFSPWKSLREEKAILDAGGDGDMYAEDDEQHEKDRDASTSAAMAANKERRTEEQRQQQADEDRWCLYYGVKALVQEGYLEAKLFLSLLDEKYGEDEQVFMLYCYRVLDVLLGGKLNWGPLRDYVSYEVFNTQYEKQFSSLRNVTSSSDLMKTIEAASAAPLRVPKTIWISPFHASLATSIVLSKATEAERTALDKKLLEYAVTNLSVQERPIVYLTPANAAIPGYHAGYMDDDKKRRKTRPGSVDEDEEDDGEEAKPLQFVDAHLWVELMMMEYKEEQAHRRAAIRLMFQTATSVSSHLPGSHGGRTSVTNISAAAMDMEQFRIMIRTLNDEIPTFVVATLFRAAFLRGNGAVNFDSFLEAAEYAQFFSSCMRLENPAASIARLSGDHPLGSSDARSLRNAPPAPAHAAMATSSRAAFVVDKYYTLMHKHVESLTAQLPIWTRTLADSLSFELASALLDEDGQGGTAIADGVHLLTTFHRLLDGLLLAGLVKKDATGGVLSSKRIFCFEKALQALLDCVREGDKTTVEQLIDAVQQKLSVKRVQSLFRKHLQRDEGAPLIMRPLFHPSYSTHRTIHRLRRAERPLKWLLFVICDVFRRSLRVDHVHWLLTELSGVSSVMRQCTSGSGRRIESNSVNGGIGPAPKPLLVELLYDAFVERFGTRCEAEKLLHDVFVNCRAYVRENHQLVVLFSYLCCMSDASPDDRLMAQNEAVAFLLAIFRCGLHQFTIINPSSPHTPAQHLDDDYESGQSEEDSPVDQDLISLAVADTILSAAFAKHSVDHLQRMKARLNEQATIWKTPGLAGVPAAMLSGSFALAGGGGPGSLVPEQYLPADAFLVLALHEWKRYIQYRLNELRVICCSMEDEIAQFGQSLPVDTIATMLQKANVSFSNDELCTIFRRMCLTEPRATTQSTSHAKQSTANNVNATLSSPVDHLSDRFAAACYPLLARETLVELQRLENASAMPFKLQPPVEEKTRFLIESWRAYDEPCRELLDELRRLGKNNDIQADAISRRAPVNGERAVQRQVLYLSSSVSSDKLSSQDVAQLEALHKLFLERLDKLLEELTRQPERNATSGRRSSVKALTDLAQSRRTSNLPNGNPGMDEEAKEGLLNSRSLLVNETWKMFRQLLVSFSRLRVLAGLGHGPLPDKWDVAAVESGSQATTRAPATA